MDNMEWIKVEDDLPSGWWSPLHKNLSEEVLVANSCSICVAYYNRINGNWYTGEPISGEWIDSITHWMPLPKNPHH